MAAPRSRRRRAERSTRSRRRAPLAFFGVRSCDLHAIAIQDRVFLDGRYVDRDYAARREGAFVVAVNCGEPGGTCFCISMGTGPRAESGFDLALTELLEGEHRFLVEAGSDRGAEILARLPRGRAERPTTRRGRAVDGAAANGWGGSSTSATYASSWRANLEHPRWDDVAERCLTCGNCTLVCPTCFCTLGRRRHRPRRRAGRALAQLGLVLLGRPLVHPRRQRPALAPLAYRQWLTHKFGTWHDQFGTSGCVGCGRCITWCPVGIDVTEELAAIRATDEEGTDAHA